MAKIEIYTDALCPFCARAKALLQKNGLNFIEIDVSLDSATRNVMAERTGGRRSVPQIFVDDAPIGGSDSLQEYLSDANHRHRLNLPVIDEN